MNNSTFLLNVPIGSQDTYFKNMKDYVNIRKYIDENNIESVEKSDKIQKIIELSVFNISTNTMKYTFMPNNKYISDIILKLPYEIDLDINNDIIDNIYYRIGGLNFTMKTNIHHFSFFNWLYGKEIKIKDGYIYFPVTNTINIYNTKTFEYHWFQLFIVFKNSYIEKIKQKINLQELEKNIDLIYQEYNIDNNFLKEKLIRKNHLQYTEKVIQGQENNTIIVGNKDSLQTCFLPFCHPVFCLYVYGFDKDDIYDVKLIFENQYIYDMNLKEKVPNIYVLEFADPLLFNTIFNEPMTNIDIFNKKTINFSRIDNIKIQFRKTNNKDFVFHIVGLNYNLSITKVGMNGLYFSN